MINFLKRIAAFTKGLFFGAVLYRMFCPEIEKRLFGRNVYYGYSGYNPPNTYNQYRYSAKPKKVDIEFNFLDIFYKTREDAEKILDKMKEYIDQYGVVTVEDLYESSGLASGWAASKYGWTNLDKASVFRAIDGHFHLDMPKPQELDPD